MANLNRTRVRIPKFHRLFKNKTILITGGTGSLGHALTNSLLAYDVASLRVFSRDEYKQVMMRREFDDERLRFLLGDVRDKERLERAVEGVNIVFHAAALKQVPTLEYNPFEAVKTNVNGTQNLIEACLDEEVELVLGASTDKAVSPLNTYGASKMLLEKLLTAANFYKGLRKTVFTCVRYGNVMGSRGSVMPAFAEMIRDKGVITMTDPSMTRFNITMEAAINFIFDSALVAKGAEVFVPILKAYRLSTLGQAMIELSGREVRVEHLGRRPGEKFHEVLINENEVENTYQSAHSFVILPAVDIREEFGHSRLAKSRLRPASLPRDGYRSNEAPLLSKQELKNLIRDQHILSQPPGGI